MDVALNIGDVSVPILRTGVRVMNECEIFMAALELDSLEERSAWLDKICANDQQLRDRVEQLLESHAASGSLLEHPAVENVKTELIAGAEPLQGASGTKTVPQIGDTNLDFLQPSDHPKSLGRLDQYEILDVIGRGGMGLVLKGRDTELNRIVAVKVLAPELASNPTGRKRFAREAQAAAAVSHDHVVPIFAVKDKEDSQPSNLPYLVMEYIDGQSLQEQVNEHGPLELKEILRIGQQVAAGLSAAHLQGLIHRDVKPSNVLLQNGVQRVKITDFGLARAVDDVGITRTGEVAGTPQYMSPEQAQGHALDPRSDLFSLGSVMYAMCTGRGPFRADTAVASLRRVCDDTPRPIREINPDVPIWLVDIIDCLLEKDPQQRYQSAEEVSELLSKCLTRLQEVGPTSMPGIVIPRKPRPAQKPRSQEQHARGKWLVAAILLLALGLMFSVTEATGVTDLAGTVIRIVTGEGTLLIEVDDPTVQVSLDGEELSITGAGLQELKLRPGQYQFTAMKDGKPFKQELVSISRGGRQVVRVTHQADASVPNRLTIQQPSQGLGAFVVLRTDGQLSGKFDTLADAVMNSSSGDVIEIRGDGPFITDPIEIRGYPLTIRAAQGFQPVIRLSEAGASTNKPMLYSDSALVVEGIEFHRLNQSSEYTDVHISEGRAPTVVEGYGSMLQVSNCLFRVGSGPLQVCVYTHMSHTRASVLNCAFVIDDGESFAVDCGNLIESYTVRNCAVVGGRLLLINDMGAPHTRGVEASVKNCTTVNPNRAIVFGGNRWPRARPRNRLVSPSQLKTSANVFDALSVLHFHLDDAVRLDASDNRSLIQSLLSVSDDHNLLASGQKVVEWSIPERFGGPPSVSTIEDWKTFWGEPNATLLQGTVRYHGGDLLARLETDPGAITPDDFRLRPDSAGYQAGPNGEDLGANIDFVGPGAPYERWKQTDEYRQWREQTDALMAGEAAQAREPFIVLGSSGSEVARFATLADAVTGSTPGDTIEIRGNGPFETGPLEITHPLRICAAAGTRPVLKYEFQDHTHRSICINARNPLILEGIEFECIQRADSNGERKPASGSLVRATAPIQFTNCQFHIDAAGFGHPLYAFSNVRLENCVFLHGTPEWQTSDNASFEAVNSVFLSPVVIHHDLNHHGAEAAFSRDSLLSPVNALFESIPDAEEALLENSKLRLQVDESLIDTQVPLPFLILGVDQAHLNPDDALTSEVAEASLPRLVDWAEDKNLYAANTPLLGLKNEGLDFLSTERGKTLEDWNQLWGQRNPGATVGQLRFQGGGLVTRSQTDVGVLNIEDFRLRPDSAGYQAGPDGEDLGANIDFVGPGAAYERWKQTDEYRQWRKQADALMAGHAAQAREPFVVVGGSGSEVGRFATLADAVTGSSAGDTIEIHSNGPFVTGPVEIRHPLRIVAGDNFHPIISLSAESKPDADYLLKTHSRLVIEGVGLQDLNTPDDGTTLRMILRSNSTAPLHVANCRFVANRPHGICILSNGERVIARNTEFVKQHGSALFRHENSSDVEYVVDNCVWTGGALFSLPCAGDAPLTIRLGHSTGSGTGPMGSPMFILWGMSDTADSIKKIRILSTANVFDVSNMVELEPPHEAEQQYRHDESREVVVQKLQWSDEHNLYGSADRLLGTIGSHWDQENLRGTASRNLEDWRRLWATGETDAQAGVVRFQGGDLDERAVTDPSGVMADDFRLRPDSAGVPGRARWQGPRCEHQLCRTGSSVRALEADGRICHLAG